MGMGFRRGEGVGQVNGDQGLKPGGDVGIDRGRSGKPSAEGGAVFAGAPCQFSLGPAEGGEAEGKPIGGHWRAGRVSILDTCPAECCRLCFATMSPRAGDVQGIGAAHAAMIAMAGANDDQRIAPR